MEKKIKDCVTEKKFKGSPIYLVAVPAEAYHFLNVTLEQDGEILEDYGKVPCQSYQLILIQKRKKYKIM